MLRLQPLDPETVAIYVDAFSEGQLALYNCRVTLPCEYARMLRARCDEHLSETGCNDLPNAPFEVAPTTDEGEACRVDVDNPRIRFSQDGIAFVFDYAGDTYGTFTVPWPAVRRAGHGETVSFEQSVHYG